jgi:hypothetical protein
MHSYYKQRIVKMSRTTNKVDGAATFRQWVVCRRGMDARRGEYPIPKKGLADTRVSGSDTLSDWLLHMAEKEWVDLEDFILAWQEACRVHRVDLERINVPLSIERARALAREGKGKGWKISRNGFEWASFNDLRL